MTTARPNLSGAALDHAADTGEVFCAHCRASVIKNYDGRGTGWSHLYPDDPLRNGTRECRPSR